MPGDYDMTISPVFNTDRKGGAFPIMLKKFRRANGVSIVRGNTNLKLARLHYVRSTVEEAAATCRANHSNNKWRPGQNSKGAFPIMLKQFRGANGVAIVRGNTNLKLARLHYVRSTVEEAAATCRANHSNNKWRPGQNSEVN